MIPLSPPSDLSKYNPWIGKVFKKARLKLFILLDYHGIKAISVSDHRHINERFVDNYVQYGLTGGFYSEDSHPLGAIHRLIANNSEALQTRNGRLHFVERILFYDFLRDSLAEGQSPNVENIQLGNRLLQEILALTEPTHMLVLGERCWQEWLPSPQSKWKPTSENRSGYTYHLYKTSDKALPVLSTRIRNPRAWSKESEKFIVRESKRLRRFLALKKPS